MKIQLVECIDCGWRGDVEECKRYVPVAGSQGIKISTETRCPKCDSYNIIPINKEMMPA